ncbi:MAG TPA: hypothetical protein VHE81_17915 [Lacipirellulaceae bacterium]|nr:hypothetical protein [Lacipirellulaceae bacterium]
MKRLSALLTSQTLHNHRSRDLTLLSGRLMGDVAIFEAATGGALKYVHVSGLLKLSDATDNEPHLALAAVRAGIPKLQLLAAHSDNLVSQRTDFNPQSRIGSAAVQ